MIVRCCSRSIVPANAELTRQHDPLLTAGESNQRRRISRRHVHRGCDQTGIRGDVPGTNPHRLPRTRKGDSRVQIRRHNALCLPKRLNPELQQRHQPSVNCVPRPTGGVSVGCALGIDRGGQRAGDCSR